MADAEAFPIPTCTHVYFNDRHENDYAPNTTLAALGRIGKKKSGDTWLGVNEQRRNQLEMLGLAVMLAACAEVLDERSFGFCSHRISSGVSHGIPVSARFAAVQA